MSVAQPPQPSTPPMPQPGRPVRPVIPQPPHLAEVEAAEQAQAKADQAAAAEPDPSEVADRRARRRFWFEVDYTDIEGKRWQGKFLSVIPTMLDEIEIEKLTAKLGHGTGDAPLPEQAARTINAIAYLTVCLKERPEWARDVGTLPEPALFELLAQEVHAHLTSFQQRRDSLTAGQG